MALQSETAACGLRAPAWHTSAPDAFDADAPLPSKSPLLIACATFLFAFIAWASWATLEEVTRGDGQVIPSSRKQVLQSLEGGIVKELFVREGARVQKGEVLLRIDDTGFSSNLGELESKQQVLQVQVVRLLAERDLKDTLTYSSELATKVPDLVSSEVSLFEARRNNLTSQVAVLEERLAQKRAELVELNESRERLKKTLAIAREEQALKAPMAKQGIVPKTDVLLLDRTVADLEGQLATTAHSVPRVEAAIREAERLMEDARLAFKRDAQKEFNERSAELRIVDQSIMAARDRVVRADIRSPVSGIVNTLHVTTIGGVVRSGEPLIEITPIDDSLLVQAKIRPQDIAFIHPGQKALVKITAYDFSVYGGLEGTVDVISADSVYDETRKENVYLITVRTTEKALKKGDKELPIIPGMVASVDVLTGEKTVMSYLLKPINKARQEAMRER